MYLLKTWLLKDTSPPFLSAGTTQKKTVPATKWLSDEVKPIVRWTSGWLSDDVITDCPSNLYSRAWSLISRVLFLHVMFRVCNVLSPLLFTICSAPSDQLLLHKYPLIQFPAAVRLSETTMSELPNHYTAKYLESPVFPCECEVSVYLPQVHIYIPHMDLKAFLGIKVVHLCVFDFSDTRVTVLGVSQKCLTHPSRIVLRNIGVLPHFTTEQMLILILKLTQNSGGRSR